MSGDDQQDRRSFLRQVLDGMGIGQKSAAKHIKQELERLWALEDSLTEGEDDE